MNNNLKKRLMSLGVAATLATTGAAGLNNVKAENTTESTVPTYEDNYEEPEHSPYEDYDYILSVCNELGHNLIYTDWVDPTPCHDGHTDGMFCLRCQQWIKKEEVLPAEHRIIYLPKKDPTCEIPGMEETKMCGDCGLVYYYGEYLDELGHDIHYTDRVEPTCTQDGHTSGEVCSRCNQVFKQEEKIPALGHDLVVIDRKEATCNEDGYEKSKCLNCGLVTEFVIPAKTHTIVTEKGSEPTCYEDGYTDYEYCSECGEVLKQKEVIPHLEHITGEMRWVKEPTCTEDGYMEGECVHCGLPGLSIFFKLGHDYNYVITKEPTCENTGIKTGTCTRCNDEVTEILPKKDHKLVTVTGSEPTCTELGFTNKVECSVCGETIQDFEVLPRLNHKYTNWEQNGYGDCLNGAEETRHCTLCDKEETRINPNILLHGIIGTEAKAPTFTEDGYTMSAKCAYCGEVFMEKIIIPKLNKETYNPELKAYELVKVTEIIKEYIGTENMIYDKCLELMDLYFASYDSKENYDLFVEEIEKFFMDFYQIASQNNIDYLELLKALEIEFSELIKDSDNKLDLYQLMENAKEAKVKIK